MDTHSHIHLLLGVVQLHRLRAEKTALIQTQLYLRAPKNYKMGQGVKLQIHYASKTHNLDFKIR